MPAIPAGRRRHPPAAIARPGHDGVQSSTEVEVNVRVGQGMRRRCAPCGADARGLSPNGLDRRGRGRAPGEAREYRRLL